MAMSQEQAKEQISYLQSHIKRQREIIGGLEAQGYYDGRCYAWNDRPPTYRRRDKAAARISG
jgi:hypothetical protein